MLAILTLVGLASATHVTTYDVNVKWTKAPFAGLESVVVDPVAFAAQLQPLAALPASAEPVENLAAKGDPALVFTNPLSSWADLTLNGQVVGIIGPYATMRLEGLEPGAYALGLQVPTGRARTFGVVLK